MMGNPDANEKSVVSIIIITYNSSAFILETLESAKNQSYKNIELIISDDSSKDNTVEICENWLENNRNRFVNSQIIKVPENTGVSANCSRGSEAARGEWIKFIAGDDILAPNCVETLLEICLKNNYEVLVSDLKCFTSKEEYDYPYDKEVRNHFFTLNVEEKYEYYLQNPFFLNVPSFFFNSKVLQITGIFNLKYKLLEDQPMIYTILKNKVDIHYEKVQVVFYRMHESSIVGSMNPNFRKNLFECYQEYRKPFIKNNLKGIVLKTMIELDYKINTEYLKPSLSHKIIRKAFHILKNTSKKVFKINV